MNRDFDDSLARVMMLSATRADAMFSHASRVIKHGQEYVLFLLLCISHTAQKCSSRAYSRRSFGDFQSAHRAPFKDQRSRANWPRGFQ